MWKATCTFLVQFQEHLFSACSKLQLGVTLGILLGDDDNVRLGSLPGDKDGVTLGSLPGDKDGVTLGTLLGYNNGV